MPYAAGMAYGMPWNAWNARPWAMTRAARPWGMPIARAAMPWARPAMAYAAAAPSSQFQAQDELGSYKYGYSGPLSAKTEAKNALGGTVGSYSYLDANGLKQTVSYVADAAGFRVKATNLPVAPMAALAAPVHTLVGPAPVDDTAEVKAAKAEFRKAFMEAAAAAEAAPDRRRRSLPMPEDTPEVKAAKAMHFAMFRNAEMRAAGMPMPTPMLLDTPAVQMEKARHAALYNQAALRAAASPDFTSPYMYGAGPWAARDPLWATRGAMWGARGMLW